MPVAEWTPGRFLVLGLGIAAGLVACGPADERGSDPPASAPSAEDVAAVWDGGQLTIAEVEEALPQHDGPACENLRQGEGGGVDAVVPCYREVAEGLVLREWVLRQLGDVDAAVDSLVEQDLELRRHALLEALYRRLGEGIEVDAQEVEAYFDNHRDDFRQPGQLTLWNIFRRHGEAEDAESTLELLRQLKGRVEGGESFETLARQYSHSETRLRDGLVGHLVEGQLPSRLEKVAFSLDEGEVSEPIPVRGGAVLLMVRHTEEGLDIDLDSVRAHIRRRLGGEEVDRLVEELLAEVQPPEGSLILTSELLLEALDGEDSQRLVLDLAGERLEVEGMRRRAGLREVDRVADLDVEERERLFVLYRQRVDRQLLYLYALESEDPLFGEMRSEAEEHTREEALEELIEGRLLQALEHRVESSPEELRSYFEDNRALFQSPLRLRLTYWEIPFADRVPTQQLARLEELQQTAAGDDSVLRDALTAMGGAAEELGWRELGQLPWKLPVKAEDFLLQTRAGHWTPAFRYGEAHHLFWVEERQEPELLTFEQSHGQVEQHYLERFGPRLYGEIVAESLAAMGFEFREHPVRHLLGP